MFVFSDKQPGTDGPVRVFKADILSRQGRRRPRVVLMPQFVFRLLGPTLYAHALLWQSMHRPPRPRPLWEFCPVPCALADSSKEKLADERYVHYALRGSLPHWPRNR